MFRGYVASTLDLVGELLLTESVDKVEVHQCLGNLLTALITSLGPDLQVGSYSCGAVSHTMVKDIFH